MAITEIPTTSTFGGVKESLRVLAASLKRFAPSDWNTLVDRVIALYGAVGKDDGTTSGSLRQALTVRTITADATLASTDRLVIIDSADPTITLTLDVGSATRGRCTVLWPGSTTDVRVLTVATSDGTGTIDGVSPNKVISMLGSSGSAIELFATGANEWHTASGIGPTGMALVTTASDTIGADQMGASIVYAAGTVTAALPKGVLGRRLAIIRGILSTFTISVTPNGSETVNGVGGTTVLSGSANAAVGTSWMLEYVDLETVGPTWTLRSEAGAIAALDTRIDTLEAIATTSISSTTGTTLSWEAQERVRLANTGTTHCLVTLNGDTTEWPVGRARALSQYGSTTGGFTLAVPSGHKLNTVTDGTSGAIGTAAADDGTALFTVMVTREASDEWSWA